MVRDWGFKNDLVERVAGDGGGGGFYMSKRVSVNKIRYIGDWHTDLIIIRNTKKNLFRRT